MRVLIAGDEMEEKGQLEEQMRAVMDKFKYKRRQIRELQEDLQTMSNTLDNLNRDEEAYDDMISEKEVRRRQSIRVYLVIVVREKRVHYI